MAAGAVTFALHDGSQGSLNAAHLPLGVFPPAKALMRRVADRWREGDNQI
jgi:hypothetical protein